MIPIRDENPSGSFPIITLLVIVANIVIFVLGATMAGAHQKEMYDSFGLVPADAWWQAGRSFGGNMKALVPFVSAMFLHGSILHILGNMWFLWLFGDNIEDRLGHKGFLLFYFACGVAASVAHILYVGADSATPMVGASGAIAGVLGAYLICYPRARVLTIVPIFIFIQFIRLPAFVFLFLWFGFQIYGAVEASATPDAPGVAWLAHVGGFAVGSVLVIFWPKSRRSRQAKYQATPDVIRAKRS